MPDELHGGRLERIERKLDRVVDGLAKHELRVESRLTVLETARSSGIRWTGILWGFGGGLVGAFMTAVFSKLLH